jgi:hypothetical protein
MNQTFPCSSFCNRPTTVEPENQIRHYFWIFCYIYTGRELQRELQNEGKFMPRMVKAKIRVWKQRVGRGRLPFLRRRWQPWNWCTLGRGRRRPPGLLFHLRPYTKGAPSLETKTLRVAEEQCPQVYVERRRSP